MAPPAWNAGFSRHSGPQGRGRLVANLGGRTRSRAIPANEVVPPPACGGLCRLKPAFQAVRAVGLECVATCAVRGTARAGLETGVPYGQRPRVDFLRMRPLLFMRPTVFPARISFAVSMSASFAQAM